MKAVKHGQYAVRVLASLLAIVLAIVLAPALQAQDSGVEALRLQLVPVSHTVLSSEIAGRVAVLNVKEGDSFRKGEALLSLDCKLHEARLAKAVAQSSEAAKIEAVNSDLDRLGNISKLEFEVAGARLAAAEAEATLMRGIVERCRITAPFTGKVSRLLIQPFQFVTDGKEVMEILDDSTLELEMFVPSAWVSGLSAKQTFSVSIDETGQDYPAVIERSAPAVDAISQTVKVFGRIDGKFAELRAGMSGMARLSPTTTGAP